MPIVPVNLADCSYNIYVEAGVLSRAGDLLRQLSKARRAMVLTDERVGPLYLSRLKDALASAGFEGVAATVPGGETHKTLEALLPVFDTFLNARIERDTPLLALGGGLVGDMAGFVAATLLRGVPLVQVPTTLLSMVDASVGGKTGVNHAVGKNLIGAFHQPIAVLADPALLTSLPRRELVSGLAECIKHDIIRDADGFARLESVSDDILRLDPAALTELVAHNVRIKAAVVQADPFERGERAHLNFGHTFGHAIERVCDYRHTHGECVALGMVAASRLAGKMGLLNTDSINRIVRLISKVGLPVAVAELDVAAVTNAMAFDKKVQSSRIRFILPDRIGHVVIRDDVDPALVTDAVAGLVQ